MFLPDKNDDVLWSEGKIRQFDHPKNKDLMNKEMPEVKKLLEKRDIRVYLVNGLKYELFNDSNYNNEEPWKLDSPRCYMMGGHHADVWLEH